MTQNYNGVTLTARRSPATLRRGELAVAKGMHATASALHEAASASYRRSLHRHGATHPTTVETRAVATMLSFYLADARARLVRAMSVPA